MAQVPNIMENLIFSSVSAPLANRGLSLKIVFFDDAHTFGGAQIAAVSLANFVHESLGHEVAFCCSKKNGRLIERLKSVDGIEIRQDGYSALPLFIVTQIFILWKLFGIIRTIRTMTPDVCVINMSGLEFGWLYYYATKFLRVRRIMWIHNTSTYAELMKRPGWRGVLDKVRDVLGNIAAKVIWNDLVTVSCSGRDYLSRRLGRSSGIKVMGNTMKIAPVIEADIPANLLTSVVGSYPARVIAVLPGRVSFGHKGHDKIVSCLSEMRKRSIAMVFVGDGEDLQTLRDLCKSFENVFFIGWQESIVPYLVRADVVLLPSRFEMQPLIAMEAMHVGAPVLTSQIPSFAELVGQDFLVDFDDPLEVCDKIDWITQLNKGQLSQSYAERLKICSGSAYLENVAKTFADAKC